MKHRKVRSVKKFVECLKEECANRVALALRAQEMSDKGLSLRAIGKELNVDYSTVHRWFWPNVAKFNPH